MEYIRTIGAMGGNSGGGFYISPERGYLLLALAVVAIIAALILMRRPE